jgi:ABC-type nitrate/sulfonate/bicarbonate transport system substrate-binding protein
MKKRYQFLIALTAFVLVAAACGDDAVAPTSAPAAVATTVAATTPPTTEAPMNTSFKLGHVSSISIYDVVPVITNDRLNAEGWNIEDVIFARTELTPLALAQNNIQVAISLYLEPLRAISAGGGDPKVAFVMENNGSEFVIIARSEMADCKALDGKRFGIHGEQSTVSVAAMTWLTEECGVNPEFLVIPGGENRIVALENDELDATLVQVGDWLALLSVAPADKYEVIDSGSAVSFSGAGYWVNTDWVDENYDTAVVYFAEVLRTFQMIHDDPTILEAAVIKYVDVPDDTVAEAVAAYLDPTKINLAPVDGGNTDVLQAVIDYFVGRDQIDAGLNPATFIAAELFSDARAYLAAN